MRTLIITAEDGTAALEVADRDPRPPGAGEVLLRVAAAAVNPADPFMRHLVATGAMPGPVVPGLDAAGTVEAVGAGVDPLDVGDPVMAVVNARRPEGGAQAELVVVPAASVVRIPEGTATVQASTLPMTGLTALQALRALDLGAGATLAVTGGAGHLASFAIPLARRRGIRVLADAAPADRDRVAALGVEDVVPRGDGFAAAVRARIPSGVDAVLDTASLGRRVLPALRDGGAIAVLRGWDEDGAPDRGIAVHAVSVGAAMEETAWLGLLADEVAAGRLRLPAVEPYPPERAAEAYDRMEAGGLRGRLAIVF
jgi:NADPH:quinone reductase-like Zn-dependent oxidoreductase